LDRVDDARARATYAEECGTDEAFRAEAFRLRLELETAADVEDLQDLRRFSRSWRRKVLRSVRPGLSDAAADAVADLLANALAEVSDALRAETERRIGQILAEHEKSEAAWRRADARAQAWFADFVRSVGWYEEARFRLPVGEHINIKEMKGRCADIRRRAAASCSPHGERFLQGLDSLVALGAASKGRSSSWKLNAPMRRVVPDILLGRLYPGEVYVPTEINPADHPTRGRSPPHSGVVQLPSWASPIAAPGELARCYAQCRERRGSKPALFSCAA